MGKTKRKALSKEQYHRLVDQRVLELAEMHVGIGKRFEHYQDFFELINFPIGSLHKVKAGERHFTMHNVFLCHVVYGAKLSWLFGEVAEAGLTPLAEAKRKKIIQNRH